MKAVVWHGIGDVRLEDVPAPRIEAPTDAIVRLTASAICGTDLHMIRGTMTGMKPGTILGHEGVGVVEEVGPGVRNLSRGDRVVIPSTIACGSCSYCRAGYYSQCDTANPNGPSAGTAFFGGPANSGPFHGLQAERARIPFAHVGLVKLPDEVTDAQAILLSDVFPTAWFGADMADIHRGSTVAVFGCGPVGLFTIVSCRIMGAGRIFAVDPVPSRLAKARDLGAETVDCSREDPVRVLRELTGGIGVDRAIDAVGVDAEATTEGAATESGEKYREEFARELLQVAPEGKTEGTTWRPGNAPSLALVWGVEGLAKGGTLSVIGVYPPSVNLFPLGAAMNKNLTIRMGNCNHRKYIPHLIDLVRNGTVDPGAILSHREPLVSAVEAYLAFDRREPGWIKVELEPQRETHLH